MPRPSRLAGHETPPAPPHDAGYTTLLRDVTANSADLAGVDGSGLRPALSMLLTLDGRLPVRTRIASLDWDSFCAFRTLSHATAHEGTPFTTSTAGLRPDGRMVLSAPGRLVPQLELLSPTITVRWSAAAVDRYRTARERARQQARVDATLVDAWLAENNGAVGHLLEELDYVTRHGPPVLLYFDEEIYSNLYVNNLAGKVLLPTSEQTVTNRLRCANWTKWSLAERGLVYAAAVLLTSGGLAGLEEFSGTQLWAHRIKRHVRAAARRSGASSVPRDSFAAAAIVRTARADTTSGVRYRRVWSLNLHKQDRRLSHLAARDALGRFLAALADYRGDPVEDWPTPDNYTLHRTVTDTESLHGETPVEHAVGYERLIRDITAVTADLIDADITLSRGPRAALRVVQAVRAGAYRSMLDTELPDFFCCVTPHPRTVATTPPAVLADSLWAIAARMQYNSWHFLPGNLPPSAEGDRRDYFLPPVVPDLALWCDQHQRGHVANGVRYAIRAPAAIDVDGHHFGALCDVRALRAAGRPFTEGDLAVVLAASRVAGAALEELFRFVAQTGIDAQVLAFTIDEYTQFCDRPSPRFDGLTFKTAQT